MVDLGGKYTDSQIAKLDKQIQAIYAEAQKDIQRKMDDFNAKYKTKEQKYQQQVNSGQMTQKEFDRWKKGQVFQGEQWQAKKDQILDTIHHSNEIATNMINGETQNIFKANANYMSYDIEHGAGINFGFGIYDSNTVSKLIKDDPQLLPKWKIDEPKDYKWSQKKLNNAITQGIIQGESLDKIANRISKNLSSQNKNKMKTFARTAMTGAQNSGRQMQLQNAKKMGIDLMKEWMATLDSHTRDSHADVDGEQVEVDKRFSNGLMYPGEPGGAPAEVYNCRCTMVSELKKYPSVYNRYNNETGERIKNMSYRDWEKAKKSGGNFKSYSIDKMAIGKLFDGLSQNGAYTKIHDVDTKLSNQFYKELQEMGKAYPGGVKPAQVWKDYLNDNLPNGVSEKKLEKIMAEYKNKASKISVAPGEALTPKIDYSKFGGKEVFDILNKYDGADQLFLFGGKDFDKVWEFTQKNNLNVGELMKSAKAAQNGISKPIKAPKTTKTVKTPPTPKDAQKESFKSTQDWIKAAKKNPNTDGMLKLEENSFKKFTEKQVDSLVTYTGGDYERMNNYLRYKAAGMTEREAIAKSGINSRLIDDVNNCKSALAKTKLEQDLVLRRGTDVGDLAGLFMKGNFDDNKSMLQTKSASELNEMFQGSAGEWAGFTSTSSQWNKGFYGKVECVIYAPKGTEAASIMNISQFGTAEGETLLNAGTKVICEKIEKSDGHKKSDIRVFLRIIN